MKMKRFLFFACTAMLALTVSAQTNVTSTYLTNADFSSTDGWTEFISGSYRDYGNGLIGSYQVNSNGGASTTDDTHLATEYCLGFECRWDGNYASYNQTIVSLPEGTYSLSFDVENTNGKTSSASYNNLFYVEVAGKRYTDSFTEWMSSSTAWTTHTIEFDVFNASDVKVSLGYGTGSNGIGGANTPVLYVSHLKLMKSPLDMGELSDASATNGVMTDFVVNGTFDSGIGGWSRTGSFKNNQTANNQSGAFTGNFYENWNGNALVNKMYQTISNIPNGTYKLKIAAFVNTLANPNESQYVFANNDKVYLTTGDPTSYEVWTVVENNSVEIGLEQTTETANWMGIDNVSLTYYGPGDVINLAQNSSSILDWEAAQATASQTYANTDYKNVVGIEKTALRNAIEADEPSTLAEYVAATATLNEATAAFVAAKTNYDALVAEIANAKALGIDSTEADSYAATSASSSASVLASIQALKVMEYNLATNTYAYEVELGTWNASSGTATNKGQHWDGTDTSTYMEQSGSNWSAYEWSISYNQDVTLPAGNYMFKVAGRTANSDGVTMSLVVKDKSSNATLGTVNDFPKGDTGYGIDTSGATNFSSDGTYANGNAGRGWEWRYVKFTLSAETTVNIAVTAVATTNHMWVSFCNATVRTDNEANISMIAYNIALNDAQNALANETYANVSGTEKTALEAAIAANPGTTGAAIDAATEALQTATSAFMAAKTNYDAYAAAYALYNPLYKELEYASAEKKTAWETALVTPTTSAEAGEKAATIPAALRAYFESHALAEGVVGAANYTERMANYTNPTSNGDWTITGNMNNPASNQPWTDADGTATHSYFDGGNWGATAWTTTMQQTVVIPAGKYLLTVKARAAENVTFTLSVGEYSAVLPHTGASGNVFNNGWADASLEFETAGEDAEILVTATTESQYQWFSISDFRLIQLESISVPMADATDYAALASAISAAEAKTLGFQKGEFAPYNNVEALTALAAAKAIDPDFVDGNTKEKVQDATSALTSAIWTSNAEDVDAIFNGLFATVTEGANYPLAWTRTNGWGQMRAEIEGAYATAYYNQPGSLQYGNQGVYTMPLAAETYYTLTFAYRSHEWNSNEKVTVSVLNGEDGLSGKTFAGNPSTSDWATGKVTFKTGTAGNYVLTLANTGNTWMTNVSLVKAVPEKVTMVVTDAKWATFIAPFDVTIPAGVSAYTVSGVEDKEILTLDVETTIPANQPVLLYSESEVSQEFEGYNLADEKSYTFGLLTGVYETVSAPVGSYVLQNHSGSVAFFKVGETQPNVTANHAYLQVPEEEASGTNAFFFRGTTGIKTLEALTSEDTEIYNVSGVRIDSLQKGLNIIKTRNGETRKVFVK